MSHCRLGKRHVLTPVEMRKERTGPSPLMRSNSFVLFDDLLKGIRAVYSYMKSLVLICCSDGTSYSPNSRWHAAFQITLCYLWPKKKCTLQTFLIKPSPTKDPKWSLWKGWQAKIQQQDDTKTTCKVISNTVPTKHSSLQFTKWNTKCWCSASWEDFLLAKYLYPPETLTIQQIMKHIKQRKVNFPSVFILVNILSVLNCLSPIFLPRK